MNHLLRALTVLATICLAAELCAQTPFSFISVGDAGDRGPTLRAVGRAAREIDSARAAQGRPFSTMWFLGDNFYPIGLNQPAPIRAQLINEVLDPFRPIMRRLGRERVHAIPGNHEYYCEMVGPVPLGSCFAGSMRGRDVDEWTYYFRFPQSVVHAVAEGSRDSVEIFMLDSGFLLATPVSQWQPVFDSLDGLLRASAARTSVRWRILLAHHSPYSVGEHGGYRLWSERLQTITYLGNCYDEGDDPYRYVYEFMSNSDNCHREYREYSRRLLASLDRAPGKIQLMMSGHDHSLQLMRRPSSNNRPSIFIINGAGSKLATVRSPAPPNIYTHPVNTPPMRGRSIPGFAIGTFIDGRLELQFIGPDATPLDMGGGATTFVIDERGEFATRRD